MTSSPPPPRPHAAARGRGSLGTSLKALCAQSCARRALALWQPRSPGGRAPRCRLLPARPKCRLPQTGANARSSQQQGCGLQRSARSAIGGVQPWPVTAPSTPVLLLRPALACTASMLYTSASWLLMVRTSGPHSSHRCAGRRQLQRLRRRGEEQGMREAPRQAATNGSVLRASLSHVALQGSPASKAQGAARARLTVALLSAGRRAPPPLHLRSPPAPQPPAPPAHAACCCAACGPAPPSPEPPAWRCAWAPAAAAGPAARQRSKAREGGASCRLALRGRMCCSKSRFAKKRRTSPSTWPTQPSSATLSAAPALYSPRTSRPCGRPRSSAALSCPPKGSATGPRNWPLSCSCSSASALPRACTSLRRTAHLLAQLAGHLDRDAPLQAQVPHQRLRKALGAGPGIVHVPQELVGEARHAHGKVEPAGAVRRAGVVQRRAEAERRVFVRNSTRRPRA